LGRQTRLQLSYILKLQILHDKADKPTMSSFY
jgi:hypothetical protein